MTSDPERVVSGVFTRDGRSILYRSDHGANENFRIFRLAANGSGLTDLTPGEPWWQDARCCREIARGSWVHSRRKPIWVQSIDGGEARVA